ncbi:hypothetical protein GCM10025874_20590 [Arenivirga flava]|uniref:Uncharacterized protein n=1 Tax=Arenivirga flava TaxID=1930060 RepID=A0AA37UPW0_9MICO|nr:hypothetical protein GCM10025874_20590 [Arenivirga flava]
MGADALDHRGVAVVRIRRADVEVTAQGDGLARMRRLPVAHVALQGRVPVELVGVVRIGERAAVGHVQAPQPHAVDRGAERARLLGLVRPLRALEEAGHAGERRLHILDRAQAGDRHAVPLVEAVHRQLVAGVLERLRRELLRLALDLLHEQHVHALALQELDRAADPGADGVDVPRGDAHGPNATEALPRTGCATTVARLRHPAQRHGGPNGTTSMNLHQELRAVLELQYRNQSTPPAPAVQ